MKIVKKIVYHYSLHNKCPLKLIKKLYTNYLCVNPHHIPGFMNFLLKFPRQVERSSIRLKRQTIVPV